MKSLREFVTGHSEEMHIERLAIAFARIAQHALSPETQLPDVIHRAHQIPDDWRADSPDRTRGENPLKHFDTQYAAVRYRLRQQTCMNLDVDAAYFADHEEPAKHFVMPCTQISGRRIRDVLRLPVIVFDALPDCLYPINGIDQVNIVKAFDHGECYYRGTSIVKSCKSFSLRSNLKW